MASYIEKQLKEKEVLTKQYLERQIDKKKEANGNFKKLNEIRI